MINEREKLIGARLRAFRETLQIPRSRFAVTIGFGSDRIASYEAGRAPLLYVVFLSVLSKYSISPLWLATQQGSPKWPESLKELCFVVDFGPRDSFSEVFDTMLSQPISAASSQASIEQKLIVESVIKSTLSLLSIDPASITKEQKRQISGDTKALEKYIENLKSDLGLRREFRSKVAGVLGIVPDDRKNDLTKCSEFRNISGDMKLPRSMEQLLAEVRRLTELAGMKAALAKYLEVPQARVSEWLAGKYKPSGKITLKLALWVSDPRERQK